jgi:hypothetical protein
MYVFMCEQLASTEYVGFFYSSIINYIYMYVYIYMGIGKTKKGEELRY